MSFYTTLKKTFSRERIITQINDTLKSVSAEDNASKLLIKRADKVQLHKVKFIHGASVLLKCNAWHGSLQGQRHVSSNHINKILWKLH